MANEQVRSGKLEPITNRELEIMTRYQQSIDVVTPEGRRKIWLADVARELLRFREAETHGSVDEATEEFERQAGKTYRVDARGPR
jgi:hypothetical protein